MIKIGDIVRGKHWVDGLLAIVTDISRINTTGIVGTVFIGEDECEHYHPVQFLEVLC